MNPAARFGDGDPLHPMDPALILEAAVCPFSLNDRDHLFEAALTRGTRTDELNSPPAALRILGVHPKQLRRKQRRFVSAGSGTDLQESVFLVSRIVRQEKELDAF